MMHSYAHFEIIGNLLHICAYSCEPFAQKRLIGRSRGVGFSCFSSSSLCYRQVSLDTVSNSRFRFPWKVNSRKINGRTKACSVL